ncbi:MAG: Pantothenate synthetase, partial [Bacteroidota bacterium]
MKVFTLATELSDIHRENPNRKIAFIPTMGALHAGHLSLVKSAQQDGYLTVVSIFVNPLQFNNPEDLEKYPRTLDNDLTLLSNQGVDVVFTPTTSEMYPVNVEDVQIELGDLDQKFEGACRPGHFHGVVQVVYRLFNYVQPH